MQAMDRSAALHDALAESFPEQASYAVALAYRVRFVMQMNAREAMHLIELRTTPQGHPAYRRVAPGDAPADRRGGRAPRARRAMRFVDHATYELERLASERGRRGAPRGAPRRLSADDKFLRPCDLHRRATAQVRTRGTRLLDRTAPRLAYYALRPRSVARSWAFR